MKTLSSFAELAAVLEGNTVKALVASEAALSRSAKIIQKDAKARIGHYQEAVGPFQDWAELAESTKEDRVRQGYSEDDPLLRSGKLRNSIQVEAFPHEAVIGSKEDIAAYQEFGTEKIPPRPFLGPAAYANAPKVARLIGDVAVSAITGGVPVHPSLGYDLESKK